MPKNVPASAAPAELSAQQVVELTLAANEMAANDEHVNAYRIRNAILVERRKNRVRYINGMTVPASAEKLLANAENPSHNHRRTLARNVEKIDQAPRPAGSCAHHIVALADREARLSRLWIFSFGIGINDGDNGVFLPRGGVGLPGHPNAAHHTPHHRVKYHLQVWIRLQAGEDERAVRLEMRSMKADLLAGRMSV
ncbi:MAG: AHH domain-containing protein [Burkholderiaceae bacterium]